MHKALLAVATFGVLAGAAAGAQAADLGRAYNPVAAPPALQTVSGDLSLYGGFFGFSDSDDYSFGGSVIGGLARANVWLTPDMTLQLDLNGENVLSTEDDDNYGVINLAGHLSWRNPAYLLGVFASVGAQTDWWNSRVVSVGGEAQTYIGPFLVYGQVGGSFSVAGDEISAVYVHGEARYFINPNLMIAANLGFAGTDSDQDGHINAIRWGADIENKFNGSPFGLFASYQGSHEDLDGYTFTVNTFLAGVKVHFNNATLQSASMAGATLKDFNPYTGVNHLRLNDY